MWVSFSTMKIDTLSSSKNNGILLSDCHTTVSIYCSAFNVLVVVVTVIILIIMLHSNKLQNLKFNAYAALKIKQKVNSEVPYA
jgi:spore coat protein U-like protein